MTRAPSKRYENETDQERDVREVREIGERFDAQAQLQDALIENKRRRRLENNLNK